MLVLSRELLQSVTLTTSGGETITVCVLDIRGGKIRLGFNAPQDVRIARDDCKTGPKQ